MPEAAMEELGSEDALVSLQERSPANEAFKPRPESFSLLLTGITPGDAYECIDASEREDVGVLTWLPFRDEGRVIGSEATDETRQETVELLDSLRFAIHD